MSTLPTKLTPLSRNWPAVRVWACSHCGAVSMVRASNHWCEPRLDWIDVSGWDTQIKYVPEAEAKAK